jgi:hypothetical protein
MVVPLFGKVRGGCELLSVSPGHLPQQVGEGQGRTPRPRVRHELLDKSAESETFVQALFFRFLCDNARFVLY